MPIKKDNFFAAFLSWTSNIEINNQHGLIVTKSALLAGQKKVVTTGKAFLMDLNLCLMSNAFKCQ